MNKKNELSCTSQNLIAVSRTFAKARKQMSLAEQKLFAYALSFVRFTEDFSGVVWLDKKKVAKILNVNADTDHLSQNMYRQIKNITKNSYITFTDVNGKEYGNGFLVSSIDVKERKGYVRLSIDSRYLQHFSQLKKDYITLWAEDIYKMNSERSVQFYEFLRLKTYMENDTNSIVLTADELKELFNMLPDAYTQESGVFRRDHFESKVLNPICEDLTGSKMITLLRQENGLLYKKVKEGNAVVGYKFSWTYERIPFDGQVIGESA